MRERTVGSLAFDVDYQFQENPSATKQLTLIKPTTEITSMLGFKLNIRLKRLGSLRKVDALLSASLESKLEVANSVLNPQRVELPMGGFDIDSILNSAILTESKDLVDVSEEKSAMGLYSEVKVGDNVRRSTILNADPNSSDGVIYSFRQLQEYKKNNYEKFERAKMDMIMQARTAQDADGCGGANERGSLDTNNPFSNKSLSSLKSIVKSVLGEQPHGSAEGKHNHCKAHDIDDCTECAA